MRPGRLARALAPFAAGLALAWQAPVHAETAGVVVAGLGGTPDYDAAFASDAATVADALDSLAPGAGAIERLGTASRASGDGAGEVGAGGDGRDPSGAERAAGGTGDGTDGDAPTDMPGVVQAVAQADRAAILAAIERQGARDVDTFALVLIGHGTSDARTWKFNVAGPDLDGDDLVAALATVRAPRQLVVLAASASGAMLETLAQPGRVVVTATKSGGEINAVRFPDFFAEALDSAVADVDRNEILTVAEAFRYADARTREHYDERKLLASEHARLVGAEAASLAVARLGSLRLAGDDPRVAALLETRLTLERDYRALLARKDELAADDYYAELETLMLAIAGLQRAIDRASGWSGDDA